MLFGVSISGRHAAPARCCSSSLFSLDALALFRHEQPTRDELEAELADLVDKQRAQMKSTLMFEVHEIRWAILSPGTLAEIVNRD